MPLKLMVADDEEVIRKGVAKYVRLHTERFNQVYEAADGQEAVELLMAYKPDMLLLDVQMPKKTGIDVMQELKRSGLSPIVIILSGYDEFQYARQALRLGAKEYLLKPVRGKDILECLNRMADEYFGPENPRKEEGNHHLVQNAEDYIAEHYMEPVSLNEVAEKLGVSRGYVSTLFSQHKKCGFVDYLNGVRVERACTYLEQDYFKIYEIAYKVGFQDEKYFTKVFKKIKGVSPKEYRIKNQ